MSPTTVTVALADCGGLVCAVASIVTGLFIGRLDGAVYVVVFPPLLVTVPSIALPPTIPLTSHVIVVPGGTHSVAVNACVCPSATLATAGEIAFAPQTISTLAAPDFVPSATLVAVTLTLGGDGGADGAVYVAVSAPVLATVPSVAFPPETPSTLHVTRVSGCPDPLTLAVNPCAAPVITVAAIGATLTVTSLSIPTLAAPLADGAATLVALTVTLAGDGKSPGAVYSPALEIVPTVAFPPSTPFTLHVTRVSVVPVTVAANACVAPRNTIALVGATLTVTFGGGGGPPADPTAPHPQSAPATATNAASKIRLVHARAILTSAAPPRIARAPRTSSSFAGAVATPVPKWRSCKFVLNAARIRLRFLAGTSVCLRT
jgi:hypothetical protein